MILRSRPTRERGDPTHPAEPTGGPSPAPPGQVSVKSPPVRWKAAWSRARIGLTIAAIVATGAGFVATRASWNTPPTADLTALLAHVGVLIIGMAGMLGILPLPRGRRSGLGLALMAISMLMLFASPAWNQGLLGAAGFLATFGPGLWLVAGPGRGGAEDR